MLTKRWAPQRFTQGRHDVAMMHDCVVCGTAASLRERTSERKAGAGERSVCS
jgi:hypothetical protein